VTVYQEAARSFAEGERVQFTAPSKELHVANRELGTVEKIEGNGDLRIKTDSGRAVEFNIREHPHLDHGYAVTSHSSQGQTADRVLVHVDTEQGQQLVNSRMAYVAVSRGRHDAQIYTDDRSQLAHDLSRDVSQRTAIQPGHEPEAPAHAQKIEMPQQGEAQAQGQGQGMST
jgi:ATP-dependent exoDNAse (exonuclease V) alpha subunit